MNHVHAHCIFLDHFSYAQSHMYTKEHTHMRARTHQHSQIHTLASSACVIFDTCTYQNCLAKFLQHCACDNNFVLITNHNCINKTFYQH